MLVFVRWNILNEGNGDCVVARLRFGNSSIGKCFGVGSPKKTDLDVVKSIQRNFDGMEGGDM